MGLREEKREFLVQSILDQTSALIDERGFESTQVEEICARLKISKPTFYRYFRSVPDVLAELRWRTTEAWSAEIAGLLAKPSRGASSTELTTLYDQLLHLARFAARDLLNREALSRAMYLYGAALPGERTREAEDQAWGGLMSLLQHGQKNGELAVGLSLELVGLVLESAFEGVSFAWAADQIPSHELEPTLLAALEVCWQGVKVRPGIEVKSKEQGDS